MLKENFIGEFKQELRGEVIRKSNGQYEEKRELYNGMIDKHPLLIAEGTNAGDVISAVQFGRENDLITAIRGGGPNGPGLGSCDDGFVIDLSQMKGIRVIPGNEPCR